MDQNLILSQQIEDLLVAKNPRGMQDIQPALKTGSYLRAAQLMSRCKGTVLIATGFPVKGTFETDGPVGAIALYQALSKLGANPILVCGEPLASVVGGEYQLLRLPTGDSAFSAKQVLEDSQPELIICIELPGRAEDGNYYNMRGVDISEQVMGFDEVVLQRSCPTIGIGDGGNEVGMGKLKDKLSELDITPCVTSCDELVIADVSNWAAHGLIAMLSRLTGENLLEGWDNQACLKYFAERGSVDGVTGESTLTEDGYPGDVAEQLIKHLQQMICLDE